MTRQDKLSEIDLQIKALQDKKKKLEERHSFHLIQTLKKTGAFSLPEEVLVGALLEAVTGYQGNKDLTHHWYKAGQEFLKARRKEKGRSAQDFFRPSANAPEESGSKN